MSKEVQVGDRVRLLAGVPLRGAEGCRPFGTVERIVYVAPGVRGQSASITVLLDASQERPSTVGGPFTRLEYRKIAPKDTPKAT